MRSTMIAWLVVAAFFALPFLGVWALGILAIITASIGYPSIGLAFFAGSIVWFVYKIVSISYKKGRY